MANHSSATVRSETPHLSAATRQRAQALINNKSIDAGTRAILRYGLEIDDPSLADLVRRVDAGPERYRRPGLSANRGIKVC